MIKVNDKWLRIILPAIPSILFLHNFWLSGKLQANVVYILTTILACEGVRFLVYNSHRWFRAPRKTLKRMLFLLPSGISYVGIIFLGSKLWRNSIAHGDPGINVASGGFTLYVKNEKVELGVIGASLMYGLLAFLLLWAIYELAYHFAKSSHTAKDRDRLEKEKLQAELQQLKGIINPHFLFNNLNSLSSLISENPSQAEDFLDELTKVFRYLLRNNETELTSLTEEMKFIQSYYHLLHTRYGKAISFHAHVDPALQTYLLPPLTLQLLVENAVKHNRIHKEYPLHIEISTNEHSQLIVKNNLAAREHRIESTGIGLRSIKSRYQLLNQVPPLVEKNADSFSVTITLIHPGDATVTTVKPFSSDSFIQHG